MNLNYEEFKEKIKEDIKITWMRSTRIVEL